MLLPVQLSYWSKIVNLIIQNHLLHTATVCIFTNPDFDFELSTENFSENSIEKQFLYIKFNDLSNSLKYNDVYDYESMANKLNARGIVFDNVTLLLTASIELSFCEAFVAFQHDIPTVINIFGAAQLYADWHSSRNRFLFVYHQENRHDMLDFLGHRFFVDVPDLLIVEAETFHSSIFMLKTNKFVGPVEEHPNQLYTLNTYNAIDDTFELNPVETLYPNKRKELQGKEVIIAPPDYPPYVVTSLDRQPQVKDHNADNPNGTIFVDGVDIRIVSVFCEVYNCSAQMDSSCTDEWGETYPNATGTGCLGLLLDNGMVTLGGFLQWEIDYVVQSTYLGISSTTCLVPAPSRLTSWALPLHPFQLTLWIAVILCIGVETISLFFTRQAEWNLTQDTKQEYKKANWLESYEFAYSTALKIFISQSSSYVVQGTSLRVLLFSCYMIDIIITSLYGGGLAAIITVPVLAEAPDSIERMVKYDLKWTGQSIEWIMAIFKAEEPLVKHLVSNYYISSLEEMGRSAETAYEGYAAEILTNGHFANVDQFSKMAIDRLKLLVEPVYTRCTVAFLKRDWALQEDFNQFILWWHAYGFSKYWEWMTVFQYLNTYNQRIIEAKQHPTIESEPVGLDIANFIGLLLIWALGIVLSALAFAYEIFVHKRRQQKLIGNEV